MGSQRIEVDIRHIDKITKELKNIGAKLDQLKPEPKRGEWIDIEETDYGLSHRICSVCRQEPSAWSKSFYFNYCPNCGARMESDE